MSEKLTIDLFTAAAPIRTVFEEHVSQGEAHPCPVCLRDMKVLNYRLRAQWVEILIILDLYFQSKPKEQWVLAEDILKPFNITCRNYSILRLWGLIEPRKSDRDAKDKNKWAGYWRITSKGEKFARDGLRLPITVKIYKGENHWNPKEETAGEILARKGSLNFANTVKLYSKTFRPVKKSQGVSVWKKLKEHLTTSTKPTE